MSWQMHLVQRVSLFEIMSQMCPAKGGIRAETTDLATPLHPYLDRILCRNVLRSAGCSSPGVTNGRAEKTAKRF